MPCGQKSCRTDWPRDHGTSGTIARPTNMTTSFKIRAFHADDAGECFRLFRDTIQRVNSQDYSPDQIAAWACADIDISHWNSRFRNRLAFVTTDGFKVVGFTDMTREGHLDRLFVSADHQRMGIATALMCAVTEFAKEQRITAITTDVSITARPFFVASGFSIVAEQLVECRGVMMTNFRMRKVLF